MRLDTIAAGNKPRLGAAEATIVVVVKAWLIFFITVLVFRIAPTRRFSNSSNVERGAMRYPSVSRFGALPIPQLRYLGVTVSGG